MREFDLAIFDLDGTLIDSKLDLANSVNATRAHFGLPDLHQDVISSYVGNGAPVLVRRALGPSFSDAEVHQALDFFLAYYREHMLDETCLYEGVHESLDKLRDCGVALGVLTNKPVRFSSAILDGLGVGEHFFRVYGGNSFEQKKPHPVGLERLLEEAGVPANRALMVGDSAVDVLTARNAGVRSCGVLYGFQPETFADAPPDFRIERMEELGKIVLGSPNHGGR